MTHSKVNSTWLDSEYPFMVTETGAERNKVKKLYLIVSGALVISLLLPQITLAKRPPKKESPYVTDIIQKARDLEKEGDFSEAEDVLTELYQSIKSKRIREEYEWLAYMNVLRNIISFYYRQGDYKEANWYHREYSDELDEDEEESGMHAMIVFDIMGVAEDLIKSGNYQKAEETFLYLTDRLEDRLGYRHWLVRLVYKNVISLYLQMDNRTKAEEYNQRLNPKDPPVRSD